MIWKNLCCIVLSAAERVLTEGSVGGIIPNVETTLSVRGGTDENISVL